MARSVKTITLLLTLALLLAAAVAAMPATKAPQPTAASTTHAASARPPVRAMRTPVPAPARVPALATTAKIQRVRIANPTPLSETNRIWSAYRSDMVQNDPYGETLLGNDSVTSEPTLQLAKSWEMSNGFKTWKFELNHGVPWHFGYGEFTAADVAHTWELLVREDALGNFKGLWVSADPPTIIDDYNVVFNFDWPMVDGLRLFSRLAGDFVVQSKAQWDEAGGDPSAYDERPTGTGSYQYGGRLLGVNIWYEKVDDHWNGENPDFQELEWIWAAEQPTRLAMLLASEVQGADLSGEVQVEAKARGMKVVSSNNESNQSFGFFGGSWLSTDNEYYEGELPWHDVRVREAMNRAIDREAILEAIYFGRATPVVVPVFAPFTEGWSDRWVNDFEKDYGYDPEMARNLLAEAGYAPGEIQLDLQSTVIPGNPEIPMLIETLQTMWEAIGIETTIIDFELFTWLNKWIEHDTLNQFSITRNTPIRTTQEGLRVFFASDPDGFFYGFEHDAINREFLCLKDSVDAAERGVCAQAAGDFIFDNYASVPMFQTTFDMTIDPEFIAGWDFPGVGSAHPTHVHNIKACPVGTDRCDTPTSTSPPKYDDDGDRLIEVSNLEQFNAIRYDLDGNGRPDSDSGAERYAAAFPTSAGEAVCISNCNGYELTRSLDFDDGDSYASGAVNARWTSGIGWLPIGIGENRFNSVVDGNGLTISNLYINRTTDLDNPGALGLFGKTAGASVIQEIGLVSVDVTGINGVGGLVGGNQGTISDSHATGTVSGVVDVGGLAGRNEGTISDSYAAGTVSGGADVGGLVGVNYDTVRASYVTGAVSGDYSVGGLAGRNSGTISASYATSNVSGRSYVGGLIGSNSGGHLVAASYATGPVSGISNVGGLIGSNSGTVIGGFWDTQTSGLTTGVGTGNSAGAEGKTTAELQSPTGSGYTGIYSAWEIDFDNADQDFDPATGAEDYWDFGTSSQYPALKADIDGDGTATWQEFGRQRMNTPPEFPAAQPERSVPENPAEGENIGVPVVAEDAEDDTLTYALGGADAASFDIVPSSGQLQTKAALDFETKFSYTVTVSVDDGQDADWNADTTSDATVTVTITVTDVDETPEVTGEAAVDYQENGAGAVAAYTATEPDNDPITWSLSGPDMGAFDIDSGGELTFNTPPDFEGPADADTDNVYEVTVEASDGGATPGTLDVTVTVDNVDETPEVTGEPAVDYQENGDGAVAAYTATEPDNDPITWSLSGPDMGAFDIDSGGELTFNTPPDFEGPADADTDNVYEVTVEASDGGATPGTLDVTVTVDNVDETPEVTLSSPNPQLGVPLMATLNDPEDGAVAGVAWQWARSSDGSTWTNIEEATSETYTPVAEDVGQYLRATAEYTDGEGSSSTAEAVSDALVTTNIAPEFPATETGERSVLESTPEGGYIGAPVAANDANDDTLTYTLGGADAGSFDIDGSTGQIKVGAGTTPDPAVGDTYTVVVTATDPSGADATITVTITVTGLLTQYDSDGNGAISKNEAIAAVRDYFSGNLTKEQTIAVIRLYFVSGG